MVMAVKDVVKVAVKIETIQIPRRIQNTANDRPMNDRGDRSPYLRTVSDLVRRLNK